MWHPSVCLSVSLCLQFLHASWQLFDACKTCVQEHDVTTVGLVSDRPDVTGKSTVSEVSNKKNNNNVTSAVQSDSTQQESSTRQLPETRQELAAAAEAAALRSVLSVDKNNCEWK